MPVNVVLNIPAFEELRKSPAVVADLQARANAIAHAAGDGFETDASPEGRRRGRVRVYAATFAARRAEAYHAALTRAIDAGR